MHAMTRKLMLLCQCLLCQSLHMHFVRSHLAVIGMLCSASKLPCYSAVIKAGTRVQDACKMPARAWLRSKDSRVGHTRNKDHALNVAGSHHLLVPAVSGSLCYIGTGKLRVCNPSPCALTGLVTPDFKVDIFRSDLKACKLQLLHKHGAVQRLTFQACEAEQMTMGSLQLWHAPQHTNSTAGYWQVYVTNAL